MQKSISALMAAITIAAMSTPSLATEWIDCSDANEEVQLGVLAGGLDFAQFSRAHLRIGNEWWSTDPSIEPGKPMAIAESYFDWKLMSVSVADDNHETILAQLHVILASNDEGEAKGGVMLIPGKGAWAVSCDGP
jgi:hypothetical protein